METSQLKAAFNDLSNLIGNSITRSKSESKSLILFTSLEQDRSTTAMFHNGLPRTNQVIVHDAATISFPYILSAGISSSAERVTVLIRRFTHNDLDWLGSIRAGSLLNPHRGPIHGPVESQ